MTKAHNVDAQRLSFILNELRLPAIKVIWPEFTERADKEGWPATRLLAALTEHEMAERDRRRIERHLSDARLPPGKTLDSFAFDAVPVVAQALRPPRIISTGKSAPMKGSSTIRARLIEGFLGRCRWERRRESRVAGATHPA